MDNTMLMEDKIKINGKDGSEYFIHKFTKPHHLVCWKSVREGEVSLRRVDLKEFDPETLETSGIWKDLDEDVRKTIEDVKSDRENYAKSKMDHARKHRQLKYPNFPRELDCIKCHNKVKVVPSILSNRLDKLNTNIEDYMKVFECQTCKPTKGRKSNSALAHLPKELECIKCHNKIKVNSSVLNVRLGKLNVGVEDYIKVFECQVCKPTKGRKSNPAHAHLPKELVCKCGNRVNTSPSALIKIAERKNTTPEEYINNYVCQKCSPTRGRPKKNKGE